MNRTFTLFRGHPFLGGRGSANAVRTAAEDALRADPSGLVILDFAGVKGVSHSFTDELLAPLSELLGSQMCRRVVVRHCAPAVWDAMQAVCEMHSLTLPAAEKGLLSA